MDTNPGCVGVSGFVYHIDASGHRLGPVAGSFTISEVDAYAIPAKEPYIMHPVVMFRRRAVVEVGGYRHVDYAEDTDLYWRLLKIGDLKVVNAVVGEYRVHAGSITSRSILNGRISAVNSQLSAISEQRRREGRIDLLFLADDIIQWRKAEGLGAMLDLVRERLNASEFKRYRFAVAAKLLELNSYRPYSLDHSDCVDIHKILTDNRDAIRTESPNVRRLWARACARLILQGHRARARTLYDSSIRIATLQSLAVLSAQSMVPTMMVRLYRRIKSRARTGQS